MDLPFLLFIKKVGQSPNKAKNLYEAENRDFFKENCGEEQHFLAKLTTFIRLIQLLGKK